jgi:hypothetical protein
MLNPIKTDYIVRRDSTTNNVAFIPVERYEARAPHYADRSLLKPWVRFVVYGSAILAIALTIAYWL